MNIQAEALYRFLTKHNSSIPSIYLSEDYQLIAKKAKAFEKSKGKMPSVDFLLHNSKKLSQDSEQIDRLDDILYILTKFKSTETLSNLEVSELLLEEYKTEKLRDLTKLQAQALVDENWAKLERIAKQVGDISNIKINSNEFFTRDIKKDFSRINTKANLVSTGIFTEQGHAISRVPIGSLVLLLARSGRGKSTLALQSALNNYLDGKNVVMFNYELQKPVIYARLKSNLTGVPSKEIESGEFLTQEASDAVFASTYVIERQMTLAQGLGILDSFNREEAVAKFEKYPLRENFFKIIAAEDYESLRLFKEEGVVSESLPNDSEILSILKEYGESIDYMYLDLISEVPFVDSKLGRELCLTNLARDIKELSMSQSMVSVIVSQIESAKSFDGQLIPKYSKSLYQSSDLVISLISNSEMLQAGTVGVVTAKARHSRSDKVVIAEADFATMTFKDTDEIVDIYEFEEIIGKELKKKHEKK